MLTIGIIGTDKGVGATHFAISVATKLKTYFKKICLFSPDNHHLGMEVGEIDEEGEGDFFTYRNVDYLLTDVPISVLAQDYEVAIFEFGLKPTNMFPQTQFQFVVSGGREWNRGKDSLFDVYSRFPHAYYVFPFATEKKEFKFAEGINIIFPDYESNPFSESKLNLSFITEDKRERGVMGLFKRAEKKKVKKLEESISRYTDELEKKEFEQAELNKKLEEEKMEALTDELTGCFNRKAFGRDFENSKDIVLVCFDINNLKVTNDSLGHDEGDKLILTIVEEIKRHYKKIYRMGGDEFNVIAEKSVFRQEDLKAIDNFLKLTTERNGGILYQVAYGFASDSECDNKDELLRLADKRMYEDKAKKKEELDLEKAKQDEERERKAREEEEKLLKIEEEARERKRQAEEKSKEEEDNGLIANTSLEVEGLEDEKSKQLSAMWFSIKEIEYQEGMIYHTDKLYIYPLEYRKPLTSLPILVVKETDGEYETFTGTNVHINNILVSARFMRDGTLKTSVVSENTEINTVKETVHNGIYTPKNFGKKVENGYLFPIRQNISGTCDSVLLEGDKATVLKGAYNGQSLTLSEKEFCIQ